MAAPIVPAAIMPDNFTQEKQPRQKRKQAKRGERIPENPSTLRVTLNLDSHTQNHGTKAHRIMLAFEKLEALLPAISPRRIETNNMVGE